MSDRKSFSDSVIALTGEGGSARSDLALEATGPEDATEKMMVSFSLAIDPAAQNELERLIAEGIRVSPEDLNTKYAVPEAELKPLLAWLNAQGFEVTRVSTDRRSVYAKASVEQIERSLGVHMVRVTRDGVTHIAAKDAPSLPADIAARVFAIGGLQPFLKANKHSASVPTREPGAKFAGPYGPLDLLQAYDMLIAGTGTPVGTGKNQVIAILIDYIPLPADLESFWQSFWLPVDQKRVTSINVNNVPMPPPPPPGQKLSDTLLETSLDTEWSSAIAREALVRVYACGSLRWLDLDLGLNAIIEDFAKIPNLNQVSLSLGKGESYIPLDLVETLHQRFVTLSALGVSVFAASGDAGSNPDWTGHKPMFPQGAPQAEFPASDPYVIAVGGTELYMKSGGSLGRDGLDG